MDDNDGKALMDVFTVEQQMREIALSQAGRDANEAASAGAVVERAEAYLAFLKAP